MFQLRTINSEKKTYILKKKRKHHRGNFFEKKSKIFCYDSTISRFNRSKIIIRIIINNKKYHEKFFLVYSKQWLFCLFEAMLVYIEYKKVYRVYKKVYRVI